MVNFCWKNLIIGIFEIVEQVRDVGKMLSLIVAVSIYNYLINQCFVGFL
jgi:uncharacterized membrane protein (DUF4010 family)